MDKSVYQMFDNVMLIKFQSNLNLNFHNFFSYIRFTWSNDSDAKKSIETTCLDELFRLYINETLTHFDTNEHG